MACPFPAPHLPGQGASLLLPAGAISQASGSSCPPGLGSGHVPQHGSVGCPPSMAWWTTPEQNPRGGWELGGDTASVSDGGQQWTPAAQMEPDHSGPAQPCTGTPLPSFGKCRELRGEGHASCWPRRRHPAAQQSCPRALGPLYEAPSRKTGRRSQELGCLWRGHPFLHRDPSGLQGGRPQRCPVEAQGLPC